MLIRILEVPCITAVECILSSLDNQGPGGSSLSHYLINFGFRTHVVRQTELPSARLPNRESRRSYAKIPSWPHSQAQTGLHFKERYGAMLKLLADNALRFEAEAISIEPHGLSRSSTARVINVMRGFTKTSLARDTHEVSGASGSRRSRGR